MKDIRRLTTGQPITINSIELNPSIDDSEFEFPEVSETPEIPETPETV